MPKSKIILGIGFFIALLPVLGFPHSWESFFQVIGGLGIVALSVLISIDKRLTLKAKAERRLRRRKEKMSVETPMMPEQAEVVFESAPPINEESPIQ